MDGYKHHVSILVIYLYHLFHPTLVVVHAHQAAKYSDSVVYVHYIIAYVEGIQVVDCELLALFYRAPDSHTVEAVEYLVVGIMRCPGIFIHKSLVDILSFHKSGKYPSFAADYGTYPVYLGCFFCVDQHLVPRFNLTAYILFQKVEVLIEPGLRAYVELFGVSLFLAYRNLKENPAERLGLREKVPVFIYIRRIQPEGAAGRNYIQEGVSLFGSIREYTAYYIYTVPLSFGYLGITVEYAYGFHLISPE